MTDRFNTIAGWVLASGIVALGLSIVSGMHFHGDKPERPETMGYPIAGAAVEGGAEEGPTIAQALATADPAAGEKVFAKCTACHSIDQGGANGIGPNLWGVIGQPIGKHAAGFAYSDALSGHGGTWDFENMDHWLANPRAFANGTKMSFAGLSSIEDRANVIAFINAHGSNLPFPTPEAPAESPAAEEAAAAPGAGPGGVEGAPINPVEAVDAAGMAQPVPGEGATNPVE